jgi:hypothetical membrane protein
MLRAGAWLWLSAVQFFAAQALAASAFTRPFSLRDDYISDLGNTACTATICSPWHAVMNLSFIAIGITMASGAVLTRGAFSPGWRRQLALVLFVAAGIGVMMVGVYPENEHNDRHELGAAVNFSLGNTALILFGLARHTASPGRRLFRVLSVMLGVTGLGASAALAAEHWGALGVGTVERLAAYPQPVWQMVAGAMMLRGRTATGSDG